MIGDLAGFAPASCAAACASCRCRPRCWRRSIPRSAARPASTRPQGKNLVGTFHQPSLVLADTDLLATLPPRELRAGYVEAAKYGLLGDAAYFAWLEQNAARRIRAGCAALDAGHRASPCRARPTSSPATRRRPATACCSTSAIPSAMRWRRGRATRTGCCTARPSPSASAWRSGCRRSWASSATTAWRASRRTLRAIGLPTRIADIAGGPPPDAATLLKIMGQDKKVRDGQLTLILARGIGEAFITPRCRPQRRARLPRAPGRPLSRALRLEPRPVLSVAVAV